MSRLSCQGRPLARRWLPALGLLLVMAGSDGCAGSGSAEGTPPALPWGPALQEALDRALREGQGRHELGLSAAVIAPGHRPWTGTSGSSMPGVPLTAAMRFNMGSIAKSFEAALALQLASEGRLDLDRPISDWLPPYPHVDARATVRQLLDHTSGIFNVFEHPDFPWARPGIDHERAWSMEEVFTHFVAEPYGPPGRVQHYSSTNYLLLTAILEEVGGTPVPQQITRRFLRPLGLDSAFVSMGDLPPEGSAIAHPWIDLDGDGQLEDLCGTPQTWIASLTHPVLHATPLDMARWMVALHRDQRVLSTAALAQMRTIPETALPDPEGGRYGLGLVDHGDLLGLPALGHGGSALGYSSAALYLPEHRIALAWAINTGEGPPDLASRLMARTWDALSQVILEHHQPVPGSRSR